MRARPLAVATLVAAAIACDEPSTAPSESPRPSRPSAPSASLAATAPQTDGRTPFQRSLMGAIAERQAQGLPVPAQTSFEYAEVAPTGLAAAGGGGGTTIVARTVLKFDNPAQAGMAEWPALVVSGDVPAGAHGYVHAGDYTEKVKEQIAQQYPDAWTNVSYESGPRTYTFAETLSVATPEQATELMKVQLQELGAVTTTDQLLLGFTVLGPNLDYSIAYGVDICVFWWFGCVAEVELVDFWAGFKLDWTIGTRLPMAMSLTSAAALTEGASVPLTSAASGEDWMGSDYEAVGVAAENGNEFVLRFVFKTGVFLEVAGADVVNEGIDVNLDQASSFATPLGPGAMLDLPTFNVSVWGVDVGVAQADVGVALTPQVGSDHFTADWLASAEGLGSGSATYSSAGQGVSLGTLSALDGPGDAAVQLSGFRYYFNQFGLDLGLYFYLSVLGYGSTWTIPVTNFDLGGVTGGLYVGPHSGTASTLELRIPIANVAPAVTIDRTGTVPINGIPTWLAQPGQHLTFTGEATDPGRDDLTLTWDWDDGPPAPDHSTTYPVPHVVSENRAHAFTGACLYSVGLSAVDDDGATGEDRVPVIVTGGAGAPARLEGYWQHQFSGNGATDFSAAELSCYLDVVAHMSALFGEQRPVLTVAQAHDVLFMGQNGGDPREQLDRELLVAWLNFAAGGIGYSALVDQNGDGVGDTPYGLAMAAIESARLDPVSTDRKIRALTSVVHRINVNAVTWAARGSVENRAAPK